MIKFLEITKSNAQINNLYSLIFINKIKFVLENLSIKKSAGAYGSLGKLLKFIFIIFRIK